MSRVDTRGFVQSDGSACTSTDDDAVDYRSRPPCPALTELIMQGLLFNGAELPKTFDPFVEEEEAATMPKPANIKIPKRAETNKTQRYHSSGSDSQSDTDSGRKNQRRMKPQPKPQGPPHAQGPPHSPSHLPMVDMNLGSDRSGSCSESESSNASSGVYLSQTESNSQSHSLSERNSTRAPHFNPANPYNYKTSY